MADITVIVPVYNAWPYVKETFAALEAQTIRSRMDLVFVDDGSTDDSRSYMAWLQREGKARVVTQANAGLAAAGNRGLEEVETEFVARMDADDLCSPRKFEHQLDFMRKNPSCVIYGTSAYHLSADGSRRGWPVCMPAGHEAIMAALREGRSAMIMPSALMRTGAVRKIGGYRVYNGPEDYDLYFRLAGVGAFGNSPEPLYSIRLRTGSMTSSGLWELQRAYAGLRQQYLGGDAASAGTGSALGNALKGLDILSVVLYRRGLFRILNGSQALGYCTLAASAVLSPSRTLSYLRRRLTLGHAVPMQTAG